MATPVRARSRAPSPGPEAAAALQRLQRSALQQLSEAHAALDALSGAMAGNGGGSADAGMLLPSPAASSFGRSTTPSSSSSLTSSAAAAAAAAASDDVALASIIHSQSQLISALLAEKQTAGAEQVRMRRQMRALDLRVQRMLDVEMRRAQGDSNARLRSEAEEVASIPLVTDDSADPLSLPPLGAHLYDSAQIVRIAEDNVRLLQEVQALTAILGFFFTQVQEATMTLGPLLGATRMSPAAVQQELHSLQRILQDINVSLMEAQGDGASPRDASDGADSGADGAGGRGLGHEAHTIAIQDIIRHYMTVPGVREIIAMNLAAVDGANADAADPRALSPTPPQLYVPHAQSAEQAQEQQRMQRRLAQLEEENAALRKGTVAANQLAAQGLARREAHEAASRAEVAAARAEAANSAASAARAEAAAAARAEQVQEESAAMAADSPVYSPSAQIGASSTLDSSALTSSLQRQLQDAETKRQAANVLAHRLAAEKARVSAAAATERARLQGEIASLQAEIARLQAAVHQDPARERYALELSLLQKEREKIARQMLVEPARQQKKERTAKLLLQRAQRAAPTASPPRSVRGKAASKVLSPAAGDVRSTSQQRGSSSERGDSQAQLFEVMAATAIRSFDDEEQSEEDDEHAAHSSPPSNANSTRRSSSQPRAGAFHSNVSGKKVRSPRAAASPQRAVMVPFQSAQVFASPVEQEQQSGESSSEARARASLERLMKAHAQMQEQQEQFEQQQQQQQESPELEATIPATAAPAAVASSPSRGSRSVPATPAFHSALLHGQQGPAGSPLASARGTSPSARKARGRTPPRSRASPAAVQQPQQQADDLFASPLATWDESGESSMQTTPSLHAQPTPSYALVPSFSASNISPAAVRVQGRPRVAATSAASAALQRSPSPTPSPLAHKLKSSEGEGALLATADSRNATAAYRMSGSAPSEPLDPSWHREVALPASVMKDAHTPLTSALPHAHQDRYVLVDASKRTGYLHHRSPLPRAVQARNQSLVGMRARNANPYADAQTARPLLTSPSVAYEPRGANSTVIPSPNLRFGDQPLSAHSSLVTQTTLLTHAANFPDRKTRPLTRTNTVLAERVAAAQNKEKWFVLGGSGGAEGYRQLQPRIDSRWTPEQQKQHALRAEQAHAATLQKQIQQHALLMPPPQQQQQMQQLQLLDVDDSPEASPSDSPSSY